MVFLAAIIGGVFGSFDNLCMYRLVKEESIIHPSSHCDKCNHELGIIDLIPILSYILSKGKCRYCGAEIPIRYPLVEMISVVSYVLLYLKFGFSLQFFKYAALFLILIIVSGIDIDTKYVYTITTTIGTFLGAIFILLELVIQGKDVFPNILGSIAAFLVMWLITLLTNSMGEGDIEVASMCGLYLGLKFIIISLLLAVFLAAIIAIYLMLIKKKNKKYSIPFIPFIASGCMITVIFHSQIINTYMKIIQI